MDGLGQQLDRLSRKIQISNTTILHEYILEQYMGAAYDRLVKPFEYWCNDYIEYYGIENSDYSVIAEWLGIGSLMFVQTMPVTDNAEEHHGDMLVDDRFISVVDETDALQAQRTVDVDEYDDDTTSGTGDPSTAQERHIHSSNSNVDGHRNDIKTGWISDKESIKSKRKHFRKQMASEDVMTEDEIMATRDLWRISIDERWRIYRHWVQEYYQDCFNQIAIHEQEYDTAAEQYQHALLEEDKQIMQLATVIGMTTTGAARYQSVLKEIRPRIVVVEEAAEVYEAHIMATVTKYCEHLIMIGDHKQLKPNPVVYKLATDYNLDISLFERMVRNGLPCDCLELQHRMRPEISCLMNHIYENLRDHDDVKKYENIKGISNNIYCIDHNIPESHNKDIRSHLNEFEAAYIVSLCKYLFLQGYTSSQITVLTMYSGQLFCLKNRMPKTEFDGVVVTTVDNYQGEENDIILLSLVRSNIEGNIGFLKIENRVCVALSRAKKGLYIVGNFDCMSKRSALWKAIRNDMRQKCLIDEGLHLYCQNHPTDDGIFARVSGDFALAPEGGCLKDCDSRLRCGHVCRRKCHVVDSEHEQYKCMEDCLTVCTNNHKCVRRCHQKCGTCSAVVSKVMPRCGHTQQVECGVEPSDFICKGVCQTELQCGHKCQAYCGEDHTSQCQVKVERIWPCGHKTMVHCYRRDRDEDCHFPCNMHISCGHKCSGNCSMCLEGRLHRPCQNKCKRVMVCGHECIDKCGSCTQCNRQCENECIHRRCGRPCGIACLPCMEPCTWRCTHYQCKRLCSEPCSRPRCDKACNITLPCGHKCIGLCGEQCPSLCKICDREKISTLVWHDGDINIQSARFVQLQDCNHIMEYKSMDRYMDAKVEVRDESVYAVELKVCPQCKTKIRKCSRYGNIINSTLHDIESVKNDMLVKPSAIHELKESIQKELAKIQFIRVGNYTEMGHAIERYRNYISKEHRLNERVLRLKLIEIQLINLLHKLTLAATKNIYTRYQESHTLSKIIKWIVDDRGSMTTNTVNDVKREISRYAAQEMIVKLTSEKATTMLNVDDVYSLIDKTFTNIVAADATKGNWRRCRKGHLFEIADECVGSYEGSTCRRCAETERDGCRRKTFPATCRHPGSTRSSGHRGRDLTEITSRRCVRDELQTDMNTYDDVIATPNSEAVNESRRKNTHNTRPYSHDHRRMPDQTKSLHSRADLRLITNATGDNPKRQCEVGKPKRYQSDANLEQLNTFRKDQTHGVETNRQTTYKVRNARTRHAETNRDTHETSIMVPRQTEVVSETTGNDGKEPVQLITAKSKTMDTYEIRPPPTLTLTESKSIEITRERREYAKSKQIERQRKGIQLIRQPETDGKTTTDNVSNETRHNSNCQDTSNTFGNDSRRQSNPNRESFDRVETPAPVRQTEATRETRDDVGNKPRRYLDVNTTNADRLKNDNARRRQFKGNRVNTSRNDLIFHEDTKMDTKDKYRSETESHVVTIRYKTDTAGKVSGRQDDEREEHVEEDGSGASQYKGDGLLLNNGTGDERTDPMHKADRTKTGSDISESRPQSLRHRISTSNDDRIKHKVPSYKTKTCHAKYEKKSSFKRCQTGDIERDMSSSSLSGLQSTGNAIQKTVDQLEGANNTKKTNYSGRPQSQTRHNYNTCQDTRNTFGNDSRRQSNPNRETFDRVVKPKPVRQTEATRETKDDVGNKPRRYIDVNTTNADRLKNDNARRRQFKGNRVNTRRNELMFHEDTKMDTRDEYRSETENQVVTIRYKTDIAGKVSGRQDDERGEHVEEDGSGASQYKGDGLLLNNGTGDERTDPMHKADRPKTDSVKSESRPQSLRHRIIRSNDYRIKHKVPSYKTKTCHANYEKKPSFKRGQTGDIERDMSSSSLSGLQSTGNAIQKSVDQLEVAKNTKKTNYSGRPQSQIVRKMVGASRQERRPHSQPNRETSKKIVNESKHNRDADQRSTGNDKKESSGRLFQLQTDIRTSYKATKETRHSFQAGTRSPMHNMSVKYKTGQRNTDTFKKGTGTEFQGNQHISNNTPKEAKQPRNVTGMPSVRSSDVGTPSNNTTRYSRQHDVRRSTLNVNNNGKANNKVVNRVANDSNPPTETDKTPADTHIGDSVS